MHINLRQLEAFKAVMRCDSITIAAEFLCISQPSVSNLIINLEKDVGFALFERRKGRIYPTIEAQHFYKAVEQGLSGLDTIVKKAEEIGDRRGGHLRIASFPAPSMMFLPHLVKLHIQSKPDLSVSLLTQNTRQVNEWIAMGNIDLGISQWPNEDPAINTEHIRLACVCAMPEAHHLANRKFITPADLDNEPMIEIVGFDMMRYHFLIKHAFGEAGARLRIQFECRYSSVACALVSEGIGVSIVDPFAAKNFIDRGITIREFRPEIPLDLGILYPSKVSDQALEFAELIKSNISELKVPAILV